MFVLVIIILFVILQTILSFMKFSLRKTYKITKILKKKCIYKILSECNTPEYTVFVKIVIFRMHDENVIEFLVESDKNFYLIL